MKVKNNIKGVLTLKSNIGESISLKPNASHTFKKEDMSRYTKCVSAYLKSGWLVEVKGKAKAEPEAPIEAIDFGKESVEVEVETETAPIEAPLKKVAKKASKKVAKKESKKVAKKAAKRTRK